MCLWDLTNSRPVRSLTLSSHLFFSLPFLGSGMTEDWVHGVGHTPVCKDLLQIVVRAVITFSLLAWTSSAGMFSCPADFHLFSDCTAAFTYLRRMGGHPLCLSEGSSVLMDLHWPCICTAQSSILYIGSVSLVLL